MFLVEREYFSQSSLHYTKPPLLPDILAYVLFARASEALDLAEDTGFEPATLLQATVFKTACFQSPIFHNLVHQAGFEPATSFDRRS